MGNSVISPVAVRHGSLKVIPSIRPELPLAGELLTASVRIENRFDEPVKRSRVEAVVPEG